jgi:LysR family pca operon transcriptional activator
LKKPADLRQDFVRNVQLRHLRAFVAVAQERHLARAASRLSLSQPAVSKTLSELEAIVGTRLVDRSQAGRRGVQGLTPAGEQLLAHALRVLEALEASAEAVAPTASGERIERLRIGALPSVAPALLPLALARLRDALARRADRGEERRQRGAARRAARRRTRPGGGPHERSAADGGPELRAAVHRAAGVCRAHGPSARAQAAPVQAVLDYPLVVYGEGTIPRHNTESFLSARGLVLPTHALADARRGGGARAGGGVGCGLDHAARRCARRAWRTAASCGLRIDTAGTQEPVGLLLRSEAEAFGAARRDGLRCCAKARRSSRARCHREVGRNPDQSLVARRCTQAT